MLNLSGAMIPEKIIELFLGFRQEGVAEPVNDVDSLTYMRMIEAEAVNIGMGRIRWRSAANSGTRHREQAREKSEPSQEVLQKQDSSEKELLAVR